MNRIVIAVVGPGGVTMQHLHGLGRQLMVHVRAGIDKMIAEGKCESGELLIGENSMMVHLAVGGGMSTQTRSLQGPKPDGAKPPGKRGPKPKKK